MIKMTFNKIVYANFDIGLCYNNRKLEIYNESWYLLFYRHRYSLSIAKNIAKETGANLIAIAHALKQNRIDTDTDVDVIGIVYPVYYGDLPVIVKEFVRKLHGLDQTFIFAVATYGGAASISFKVLRSEIRKNGGKLSSIFGIHMPQNAFNKPRIDNQKICSNADKKCVKIGKNILKRRRGVYFLISH